MRGLVPSPKTIPPAARIGDEAFASGRRFMALPRGCERRACWLGILNARLMAFDAMAAREKRRGKSSLDARARYPLWQRTRRPPPWSRTARSNLRRRSSERIVPDRGVDDVVVGRRIAPDSDEGLAFRSKSTRLNSSHVRIS